MNLDLIVGLVGIGVFTLVFIAGILTVRAIPEIKEEPDVNVPSMPPR